MTPSVAFVKLPAVPLFNQTPPPQPNPGDKYDPSRETSHIQASKESQDVSEGMYNYLDQFPPTQIQDAASGNLYWVLAQLIGSGNASSSSRPFFITITGNATDGFFATVNTNSYILTSAQPASSLDIDGSGGTGVALGVPFPFDPYNDCISLYIIVDNSTTPLTPTNAGIQSWGAGTSNFDPTLPAWDPSDESFVFDDGASTPQQIGINILLGYASTDEDTGLPFFIQCQDENILLENCNIDNRPAVYDFSHRAPYGLTTAPT